VGPRTSLDHMEKILDPTGGLNKLQKPKKAGLRVDTGLHLPEIMKCSHVKVQFFKPTEKILIQHLSFSHKL
jgi:hypothetical protein